MKSSPFLLAGVISAALMLATPGVLAQTNAKPPTQMTYQGFLTDANGQPFGSTTPVNKTVIFRVYDSLTLGNLKWSSQQVVTVDKGYFSVLLGQGSAVGSEPFTTDLTSLFTGVGASDRYLELTADGVTIAPRLRFYPAPYAILSKSSTDVADPATGTVALSVSGGQVNVSTGLSTPTLNVTGNLQTGGTLSANNLSGNGANLTGLNAAQLTSGTIPVARIPGLDASQIVSGTLPNARTTATSSGTAWTIVGRDGSANAFFGNSANGGTAIGSSNNGSELKLSGNGYHHFSLLNNNGDLQVGTSDSGASIGVPVTPYFTLRGNGNLGIGPTAPETKLHISESTGTAGRNGTGTIMLDHDNAGGMSSIVFRSNINRNSDFGYIQFSDNSSSSASGGENAILTIGTQNDGDDHIALLPSGNVGIGTTTPVVKLDVRGLTARSQTDFKNGGTDSGDYANKDQSQHDGTPSTGFNVSVRSEGYMEMLGAVYYSDKRIKKITGRVESKEALKQIEKLQVTNYRMVDPAQWGKGLKTGLIAQEVEAVMPEAISKRRDFVPDVYEYASAVKFSSTNGTLRVSMDKPHGFKAGETLRLFGDKSELIAAVTEVPNPTNFVVSAKEPTSRLFVYGRQVDDFLAVDYDRIFTVSLAAIQELARDSRLQAAELTASQARVAELERKVDRMTTLESEVAALKKLLTELVPASNKTPSGGQSSPQAAVQRTPETAAR